MLNPDLAMITWISIFFLKKKKILKKGNLSSARDTVEKPRLTHWEMVYYCKFRSFKSGQVLMWRML